MRLLSILFWFLVCSFGAAAQNIPSNTLPPAALSVATSASNGNLLSGGPVSDGPIIPASSPAVLIPAAPATFAPGVPSPNPELALPQQTVGVRESYSWQLAANYMFLHFDGMPPTVSNYPYGIMVTGNYYFKSWLAAEGSFLGTGGTSQGGIESHFVFAGGGPRFRWSLPRDIELFGHGLVGHSHYGPQTSFGPKGAFGYAVGGGVDVNAHHQRYAYRFGADMVGSHLFGTEQYNPVVYAGFVFKF